MLSILIYICKFIMCILINGFMVHESGHAIAAACFYKKIKFVPSMGKLFNIIPIPRFIWSMPENLTLKQKCIISISGFGLEFLYSIICYICGLEIFMLAFLVHLFLYKFYAGEANDFNYVKEYFYKK